MQGDSGRVKPAMTLALISITLLALVRLVLALRLDLFGDEAFYWQASQHLALAYSDLPGLTAWLVATGVGLMGHQEWAVRLVFMLLGVLLPLALYWAARPVVGIRDAWLAAAALALIPLLALNGVLALPDVPLLLLCTVALGAMARALSGQRAYWLLLGLALALAFASHYRALVLAACAGLAVLLIPEGRRALKTPWPWLAALVALGGLLPIVLFNWQYQGAGLEFQLLDRHPWRMQPEGLLQPLIQALATTPLVYITLLVALVLLLRRGASAARDPRRGTLLVFALVPIAGYLVIGLFADQQRSSVHWPLQGYLALLPLLPGVLRQAAGWVRLLVVGTGLAGSAAFAVYLWLLPQPGTWLVERVPLPDNLVGWTDVSAEVDALLDAAPDDARLVADNFMLGAQLAFSLGDPRGVYVLNHPRNARHGRALQYRIWGLDQSAFLELERYRGLLVQEEDALDFARRPAFNRDLCRPLSNLEPISQWQTYGGRRSFRFYWIQSHPRRHPHCHVPPVAYLDEPAAGQVIDEHLMVTGWAFGDFSPISRVEVRLDGRPIGFADYGQARPEVRRLFSGSTDSAHPAVGYRFSLNTTELPSGRHQLAVIVVDEAGVATRLPGREVFKR